MRINGARRTFPQEAYAAVLREGGEWTLGIGLLAAIWYWFRAAGRRFLSGCIATVEEARAWRKNRT